MKHDSEAQFQPLSCLRWTRHQRVTSARDECRHSIVCILRARALPPAVRAAHATPDGLS
jgi:hypothetical protein